MKCISKIAAGIILASISVTSSYAALTEVSCSTDSDYTANSCNQCFTGGSVNVGDNKGLLTDIWENTSGGDQVLFKEEQEMPKMIALGGTAWSEVTVSDDVNFWQFTPALEALYDDNNLGYTLADGGTVTWLESTLGSAYQLTDSSAAVGSNVGVLAYDIAVHNVEADGNLSLDTISHRECVMYTAAGESVDPGNPSVPQTPKLPETGAEHILLAFVALFLGFGFLKFRRK